MSGRGVPRIKELAADLRAARVTWALLALLALVHAGFGMLGEPTAVYEIMGLSRDGLTRGRGWSLLSYALVHGSWGHLACNGLMLLALGPRIERIVGGRGVLRIGASGVLAGGLFHLLATPGVLGQGVLVGASAGMVALLLWLTTVSPDSRMWPLPVSGRNLGRGVVIASALLALMDPGLALPGLSSWGNGLQAVFPGLFRASHACHLGGAVAGWLWGRWELRPRVTLERLQRQRARREGRD